MSNSSDFLFYSIGNPMESNVGVCAASEVTWKIKQLEVEGARANGQEKLRAHAALSKLQ